MVWFRRVGKELSGKSSISRCRNGLRAFWRFFSTKENKTGEKINARATDQFNSTNGTFGVTSLIGAFPRKFLGKCNTVAP